MRECIGKNSPVRYASLASTYDRIGQIYNKLGNHLDASTFYRKALRALHKASSNDTTSLERYHAHLERLEKLPAFFDDNVYQKSS